MPFKHGLFGCFDNIGLCVITYFVPCYTYGKNAEAVGENCLLCGLVYFVPVVNFLFHILTRGKIRQQSNIEGSILWDCLAVWFCPCCALVQEAQEVQAPGGAYIERATAKPTSTYNATRKAGKKSTATTTNITTSTMNNSSDDDDNNNANSYSSHHHTINGVSFISNKSNDNIISDPAFTKFQLDK